MKQTIYCEIYYGNWSLSSRAYNVKIKHQIISENSNNEFCVAHEIGMTNEDVKGINFIHCTMLRVPQGLTKIFPNAKFLQMWDCKLKSVKREDLKEYSKFIDLTIVHNEIPFLPGDLLADMKNLIGVWLHDNKTQIIEPNLLDGLINLKTCDLSNNLCINMCYDDLENEGNASFGEIRNEIQSFFENSPWRAIYLENKMLKAKNNELEQNVKNKVAKDLEKIIQNDDFKDFTIMVDGEKFQAHKLLLAARCPIFAEMIQKNIHAEHLNLMDISKEIFMKFSILFILMSYQNLKILILFNFLLSQID